MGAECLGTTTGGMWTADEASDHINCLELILSGFVCFAIIVQGQKLTLTYKLQSDNSTTVACINNNGSIKPACNDIARDI